MSVGVLAVVICSRFKFPSHCWAVSRLGAVIWLACHLGGRDSSSEGRLRSSTHHYFNTNTHQPPKTAHRSPTFTPPSLNSCLCIRESTLFLLSFFFFLYLPEVSGYSTSEWDTRLEREMRHPHMRSEVIFTRKQTFFFGGRERRDHTRVPERPKQWCSRVKRLIGSWIKSEWTGCESNNHVVWVEAFFFYYYY